MLDIALKFLCEELNGFFRSNAGLDAAKANLRSVLDADGKYAVEINSIGASIINIEEERVVKTHLPQRAYLNGQHAISEPDLKLNLYILFAANFGPKVYDQALKYLSFILRYFQSHPAFTPDEFSGLDSRIEKLALELVSTNFEQWNQIWGCNGGKQLPSLIYKARMLVIQPETPTSVRPPLATIGATLHKA
jgi:hypothetical protein